MDSHDKHIIRLATGLDDLMDRSLVNAKQCSVEKLDRPSEEREARLGVLSLLPPDIPDDPHILDVGPGGGWNALQLADRYRRHKVHGVTLSDVEARICGEHGVAITVADMHTMPGEWRDRYALLFASHVLEHSPAPFLALLEFRRVLADSGYLAVVMPEPTGYTRLHDVSDAKGDAPLRLDTIQQHLYMPGIAGFVFSLRKVGFEFVSYHEVPQICRDRLQYCHRVWIARKQAGGQTDIWRGPNRTGGVECP